MNKKKLREFISKMFRRYQTGIYGTANVTLATDISRLMQLVDDCE